MFPNHPRRPMGPRPIGPMHRRQQKPQGNPFSLSGSPRQRQSYQQPSNIQNVISMFRDDEGNMDIGKMIHTAEQINGVYKQVSPMITRFMKK